MRTIIHFSVAFGLMVIYGGEVCPLIDTLTLLEWGGSVLIAFLLLIGARHLGLRAILRSPDVYSQAMRQFRLDFFLFVLVGLIMCVWNIYMFHFPPIESGLKITIGFACVGFFVALDLALRRERHIAGAVKGTPHLDTDRVYSTTRNFTVFTVVSVLIVGVVLTLAVTKDVYWLTGMDYQSIPNAQMAMILEISFILTVLLGYMLAVALTYSRNMHYFLEIETSVLEKVEQGHLDVFVPTRAKDEFGQIAGYTNRMIEGLRERERIKNVFGKAVSPDIAATLMGMADEGVPLGGSSRELTIMFADVRNFTSRMENADPQVIITELNAYFTEAVTSVRLHGGVVDKFIGDGMLAIFGLDGRDNACINAARCARDIQERLKTLNPTLSEPLSVSMGIHRGTVIAGIIGSPDRLEYTVMGDVVNTAARLETLTRPLGVEILVSEVVHASLPENERDQWRDMGEQTVKGKLKAIRVFALSEAVSP